MKRLFLLAVICFAAQVKVLSQNKIPVDLYKGTPQISVPLWNLTSHDLSESIELDYDAKGLRVDQPNGKAGLGWTLDAGGSITREVRGLPDDFTSANDTRRGWLYTTNGTTGVNAKWGAMANTADLSKTTCTDESSDHNTIAASGSFSVFDAEPDIFTFKAEGLYGKFVFDNASTPTVPLIRLIPYQDIKVDVEFTAPPTDLRIKSFTITTNTGVKYIFGTYSTTTATNVETRYTTKLTNETTVEYFNTKFALYNTGQYPTAPAYNKDWMLLKITSPTDDELTYTYAPETYDITDTIRATIMKNTTTAYWIEPVFLDRKTGTHYNLNTINSSAGMKVTVNYNTAYLITDIQISDSRRSTQLFRTFTFTYTTYFGSYRASLVSVQESYNGTTLPPYKFDYVFSPTGYQYSKSKDFWGYYNGRSNTTRAPIVYVYPDLDVSERYRLYPIPGYTGMTFSLDGADRTPDPIKMKGGTLTGITYPWNGKATIEFEANYFYDPVAATNVYGQGLRIKSVTYEDILNPDSKVVETYSYTEAGDNSSGRILHYPAYALSTYEYRDPQGTNEVSLAMADDSGYPPAIYKYMTVRMETDLYDYESFNDESVGYKLVNVYKSGSGHTQVEMLMPGAYNDAAIGDWTPTLNKFARPGVCPSMEIVTSGGTKSFPFAADPNFDHERGLIWRTQEFNEANTLVRKKETTYQSVYATGSTAPTKVWGCRYEKYPNCDYNTFFFGKYYLLTGVAKFVLSETVTIYDVNNAANNLIESTSYQYANASAPHRLLTKVVNTKADGNVYTDYYRYPLDYGTIPASSDTTSQMIGLLQTNFRNGTPIEQYSTFTRSGGSENVIRASFTRLNDFGLNKILPKNIYQLSVLNPVLLTAFTPSFVDGTTKTFKYQSGYEKAVTILEYDAYGLPKSSVDLTKMPKSVVYSDNTSVPLISIDNARLNQVAYSDFDHTNNITFDLANNSGSNPSIIYTAGRIGTSIYPLIKLSKTLNKGFGRYIFSGWWNKATATIDINIVVMNTAKTTTYYNRTFTIPRSTSTSGWEYFEVEFPIDPTLTDFYAEIKPNGTTAVFLDNLALYPSNASMSVSSYTFPYGQASTTTGDKTMFTEYDDLGRIKYIKDKDQNILEKRTYEYTTPAGTIYPYPPY